MWNRWVGFRSARRHLLEERSSAIEIRERIKPQISEYDRFHLVASEVARRLDAALASLPRRPSTEKTNGVKVRRRSMQSAPYLSFFSFSWRKRTLEGAVLRLEGWSVSVMRTSKIAVLPRVQKPWTARSPRSSEEGSVRWVPSVTTFRLGWMKYECTLQYLYSE
jgi:hypothetical protein